MAQRKRAKADEATAQTDAYAKSVLPENATYTSREADGLDRPIVEQHLGEPGDADAPTAPAEEG